MVSKPAGAVDDALRTVADAIVSGDRRFVSRCLQTTPSLATARFHAGATRTNARTNYLEPITTYIVEGDTALHVAAAAYRTDIVRMLLAAGADVRARNRHGAEPLHAASMGVPGSSAWNPCAQADTIAALIDRGADPNAADRRGVTPLHRAVRTRCAGAVRALLDRGADPASRNKNGSTPALLARLNTGRGGSGLPDAKAQQQSILEMIRSPRRGATDV